MCRTGHCTGLVISLENYDPNIKGKETTVRGWIFTKVLAAELTCPADSCCSRNLSANWVRSCLQVSELSHKPLTRFEF